MIVCEWVNCVDRATRSSNDDVPLCEEHYEILCDEWIDTLERDDE